SLWCPAPQFEITSMAAHLSELYFVALMLLPGAAGGLASFLVGLKAGHYKNNKYMAKCSIETVGGAVTASSLVYFLRDSQYTWAFAFAIGAGWSQILQGIRGRVTRIIVAVIGEAGSTRE